jgi:hypothetical protein
MELRLGDRFTETGEWEIAVRPIARASVSWPTPWCGRSASPAVMEDRDHRKVRRKTARKLRF